MNGGQPATQRGGGNVHDGPAVYYTLDVFVESIEEPAVGCRVPAVSFQFLDYPAVKIFADDVEPVAPGRGAAVFRAGKSCVLRLPE